MARDALFHSFPSLWVNGVTPKDRAQRTHTSKRARDMGHLKIYARHLAVWRRAAVKTKEEPREVINHSIKKKRATFTPTFNNNHPFYSTSSSNNMLKGS